MRQSTRLLVILSVLLVASLAAPAMELQEPNPEFVENVREAIPDEPRVEPAEPRRVLVFSLTRGFYHGAIPLGAKMFEMMGEKTGAFEAVLSNDIAMFEPENLAQFDAVIMNNTTGEVFTHPNLDELDEGERQEALEREARLKESFLDFVRNGGGLVGVHAATDTLYQWEEYGEMIGGYFHGHPWNADDTVHIKIDDPAHPLVAAFEGQTFAITDEIYQFREPYSRENLRVLMSLDTDLTDMTKNGIHRTDDDFAISWVRSYGEGRVFYCSLGHNEHVFWTPNVVQHYLDGVQFAVGDLEADTTPSAALSDEYIEESRAVGREMKLDGVFEALAGFEFGDDSAPLQALEQLAMDSHGDADMRAELEKRFLAVLEGPQVPFDAALFACRQLYIIGTEASVPVLAGLLHDEQTAHPARYALERLPESDAVDRALRETLDATEGRARLGIIASIGERRDHQAIGVLTNLLADDDAATAKAAAVALGKIGGSEARDALSVAKPEASRAVRRAIDEGLLYCAEGFAQAGDEAQAVTLYEALYGPFELPSTRAAALVGLAAVQGEAAVPYIREALHHDQVIVRTAAAEVARTLDAPEALLAGIHDMEPDVQALLIHAMADRVEVEALGTIRDLFEQSDDEEVRVAALNAIGVLGTVPDVPLLARAAAEGSGAEVDAARRALYGLRGNDVDFAIVRQLDDASSAERVELVRSLGQRHATLLTPTLIELAEDDDTDVRIEAFRALTDLATAEDAAAITHLMLTETDDAVRTEAENVLVAISRQPDQHETIVEALIDAYPDSEDNPEGRAAIVQVLGELGDDAALDVLRAALDDPNEKVSETAIRALANWPTPAPLDDLYALAQEAPSRPLRIVALRSYLRLLEQPSDRDSVETVQLYEQGLALAEGDQEKRLALSGLAQVPHPAALEVMEQYVDDPDLGEHAQQLVEQMKSQPIAVTASRNADAAENAVDGDRGSRWTTGETQRPGQWFQIDLGWERAVQQLVLDSAGSGGDYPRGYEVYVTNSLDDLGEPVAEGDGDSARITLDLGGAQGRFIRIVQTSEHGGLWWSIHELELEFE